MSLRDASPLSSKRIASKIYGTRSRLTTNAGVSLQAIGVLPRSVPNWYSLLYVLSDVKGHRITSTSCIISTGLKCRPPNLSCLFVAAAISEIGRDVVLDANRVFFGAASSKSANSPCYHTGLHHRLYSPFQQNKKKQHTTFLISRKLRHINASIHCVGKKHECFRVPFPF